MAVILKDNSSVVLRTMDGNVTRALEAMGVKAESLIVDQMQNGYRRPVRQTGNLMRDVQHEVRGSVVIVGNTLKYGPLVHEGTYKMVGRPYIRDALFNGLQELRQVASEALKKGF